jgi:hypothetical protein
MHFVGRVQKLRRFCFAFSLVFLAFALLIFGAAVRSAHQETAPESKLAANAKNQPVGWYDFFTAPLAGIFSDKADNQSENSKLADAPVFGEFEAWLRAFADNGFAPESEHLRSGENLAIKRAEIFKELARTNPQAALEKSVSAEIYNRLPVSVSRHLERKISARGDFLVFAVEESGGARGEIAASRTDRFVVIGGERYEAVVYGRRAQMTTKYDIPLAGVVIENAIVLDENPARKLDSAEYAARGIDQSRLNETGVAAEIGGKIEYFADASAFENFVREQIEWEAKIAPRKSAADAAAPGSVWTEGPKTVLVVRVDFSDRPGEPLDHFNQPLTAARAQNLIANEVSPFFVNNSYGKTSLQPTVTPVLRLPRTQAAYALLNPNTLLIEADNAARAAGFDSNNYDLELVTFSYTPSIGWVGIAAIGAQGAMLNGAFYLAETAHELGHNYGLLHANLWRTIDGTPHGAGSNVEYGDCYDNMGACVNGNSTRHFNSRYKRLLDWLTDANAQTVTTNGTYRIFAQDSPSPGGLRTLKIPKDATRNYWVEFRQLQTGNPNAMNGALIRWDYSSQSYRETQLLDMNPTTSTTADAPLVVGQSFYDSQSQIRITVLGKGNTSPESLDVRVEFGNSTPTPTPTATPTPTPSCSFALSPTSVNVSANGGNGSFSLIASNAACAWTPTANVSWINVISGGGAGNGTVIFAIAANSGAARSGTISAGGQIFTVNQESGNTNVVRRPAFDFDGDGRADVSVYRPADGAWYLLNSSSGFSGAQFGIATDKIVPADYDGDGKTDIAVYRSGVWYLLRSTSGFTAANFGVATDIPMPADFDGDGRAEIAVFRPSTGAVYSLNLTNNQFTGTTFGLPTDKFVGGDYDGDGRNDLAIFRDGIWTIRQSSNGQTRVEQFGQTGDVAVSGDFDGDGRADLAVFRGGIWYVSRSQLGFLGVQFGAISDKPVPADYDGDGKTDIAVFRSGVWYILQSSNGGFYGLQFGIASDQPTPFAFSQ